MKKALHFVVPKSGSFISGGNIYNDAFIQTLQEVRPKVFRHEFAAFLELEKVGNRDYSYWFDTLYLDQIGHIKKIAAEKYLIIHHLESLYPPKPYTPEQYFEQFEKEPLEAFNGYLVTSPFTASFLSQKGLKNRPIYTCPPAMGLNVPPMQRNTKRVHGVMVANLVERKGILPFLEALDRILKPEDPFSLKIVGEEKIEPDYAQLCKGYVHAHKQLRQCVQFYKPLPHRSISSLYQQANLFISASFMETYGMALQEAKAMGLPILSLDRGNCRNHIEEGKNGKLFSDIQALSTYIRSLLDQPDTMIELCEGAYAAASTKPYTWKDVVQAFLRNLAY